MKTWSTNIQLIFCLSAFAVLMTIGWNEFLYNQYPQLCASTDFSPVSRCVTINDMPHVKPNIDFETTNNTVSHSFQEVIKSEPIEKVFDVPLTKNELIKNAQAEPSFHGIDEPVVASWYPQFFSTNMTRLLNRGANFITPISGCMIASWVVTTGARPKALECHELTHEHQVLQGKEHLVQEFDTIYVAAKGLAYFSERILPRITAPGVVVIAGQYNRLLGALDADWEQHFLPLYANPKVIKIFCHSAIEYARQDHPKLEPFPFGFQHEDYEKKKPSPLDVYREVFFQHLELPEKTNDIFISFLRVRNKPNRKQIPIGPPLPLKEYYNQIAKSKFILSPNGDRPECYRHYEAIGLGTIPITELDPHHYRHLRDAPVVYNTSTWTLNGTTALQLLGLKEHPIVNRNMVFEEYWMEYVERVVGHPLRWWDRHQKKQSFLMDFYVTDVMSNAFR